MLDSNGCWVTVSGGDAEFIKKSITGDMLGSAEASKTQADVDANKSGGMFLKQFGFNNFTDPRPELSKKQLQTMKRFDCAESEASTSSSARGRGGAGTLHPNFVLSCFLVRCLLSFQHAVCLVLCSAFLRLYIAPRD